MKNNLKNKIMLAFFAGNMLCMGSAWADDIIWYGTADGTGHVTSKSSALMNNAKLIIAGTEDGIGDVDEFYGGYSQSGIAENNEVKINGGSVSYVYGGSSVSNNAVGNTVTINGGIITEGITGGNSGTGNVSENHVVIVNGKVDGYIFGGDTAHGNATGNVVELNAGDIDAEVYGGFSNGGGEVKDNTVILNGADVSGAKIYGYYTTGSHSGNKLEVKKLATAISVSNFDIINFTLPSGTTDGSKILNASTVNLSGTKINVGAVSGLTLNADDTITLIHTTNGITGTFTVGNISLKGNWEILINGNDIVLLGSDD
ncbi:MAG: hypothetical protein KBS60_02535, partial [Phascolarctobacterium sp.]|nr:hypothetical protein [Candidatus Phascolarctobacterium caballi]